MKTVKYPNKLKEYRLNKKLTQKDVVIKLDLKESENRLSRWENGIALPNVLNFLKLCRIYEIEPDKVY
ncbi:MAG: helix-turn-helix transcriptional regulator [Bacteroidota bacterium]